jgi:hypothetical protein
MISNLSLDRVLNICIERMLNEGWESMLTAQKISSSRDEDGSRVLMKNGEACWIQARTSPRSNQVLITFSCKKMNETKL